MSDIRDQAIHFETSYIDMPVGSGDKTITAQDFAPEFTDIHISNVTCRDARIGVSANGTVQMIHGITLKDCIIFYTEKGMDVSDPAMLELDNVQLKTWE